VSEGASHTYRQRPVVHACIIGGFSLFIVFTWWAEGSFQWSSVALVVAAVALSRQPNITLDSDGVHTRRRSVPWTQLDLIPKSWTDVLSAKEGQKVVGRMNVPLRFYAHPWRDSQLGLDLARWAPHLLERVRPTSVPDDAGR
jgi:hypothetical protein